MKTIPITERKQLTQAQRRAVDSAFSKDTRRVERPITAGFAVAAWERMMEVLCEAGVFKPYSHGGAYELTESGVKLGRPRKGDAGTAGRTRGVALVGSTSAGCTGHWGSGDHCTNLVVGGTDRCGTHARDPLSFARLREQNSARCPESFHHTIDDYSPNDWLCRIVEEVGEVADLCSEIRKGHDSAESVKLRMGRELADVISYCDLMAERFRIDLGEAVREKFNLVSDRVGSGRRL